MIYGCTLSHDGGEAYQRHSDAQFTSSSAWNEVVTSSQRSVLDSTTVSALVLAAGSGTRLRPYTERVPKALLPVLDQPMLGLIVAQLARAGIDRIGINACHHADQIIEFAAAAEKRWQSSIEVRVEVEPSGPAGALRVFADLILESDVTVVVSGDSLVALDIPTLVHRHITTNADLGVLTSCATDAERYGVVMTGARGRVVRWDEKPHVPKQEVFTVSCGVYTVTRESLDTLRSAPLVDFGVDLIGPLIRRDAVVIATPANGYWCDIGSPKALLAANLAAVTGRCVIPELQASSRGARRPTSSMIANDDAVFVGAGAVLQDGIRITGPAIIGAGSYVGQGAHIERSLLLPGAHVVPRSHVVDEIIGELQTSKASLWPN